MKTLENSDFRFRININSKIESLNISNSVAVVCHYIKTKKKLKKINLKINLTWHMCFLGPHSSIGRATDL